MTEGQMDKLKALAEFQEVASIYDISVEYDGLDINNPWLDLMEDSILKIPPKNTDSSYSRNGCKKANDYINAHSVDSF